MMWVHAVWLEGNIEDEGVIPLSWVDERQKIVLWPNKNERQCLAKAVPPENDWMTFNLKKIKKRSEIRNECKAFDETATAKLSEDEMEEEILGKRQTKKRTYEDCATESTIEAEIAQKKTKKSKTYVAPDNESESKEDDACTLASHMNPNKKSSTSKFVNPATARQNHHQQEVEQSQVDTFPMDEGRFQKRCLYLLTDIRNKLAGLGKQYEPSTSDFHIQRMESLEEFDAMESALNDDSKAQLMITRLSKIGGVTIRDATNNVLQRLLSNDLMARFNMAGNRGKRGLAATKLLKVVKDSVLRSHKGTEMDVHKATMKYLKYAPDRAGGGGRMKNQ